MLAHDDCGLDEEQVEVHLPAVCVKNVTHLLSPSTKDYIEAVAESKRKLGFGVYVYETYVTRKNLMGGREFQERYDTPYYCSPSSEYYWSM